MAVAVVQKRSTSGDGVTSVALAFSSNNAAASLLAYFSGCFQASGGGGTMSAATDSNTNTIANAVPNINSAGNQSIRADYVASSHSGANTVTAHDSPGNGGVHLHIWEISGCATVSPVRDSGSVATSTTMSVSTAGSSTLSGDAVLAFFYDDDANDTLTIGSGYTDSTLSPDVSGGDAALSEFKAATAGGAQTATCGGNGTHEAGQIIVTFKAGAAAFQPDEDYWIPPAPAPIDPIVTVF